MEGKLVVYLVAALICCFLIIVIALASLLMAWRKIKNQEGSIGGLIDENAAKSNRLREKGCEIDRLEKTIKNLQKQRRRL